MEIGRARLVRPESAKRLSGWVLCVFALVFPVLEGFSNAVVPVGTRLLGVALACVWLAEVLVSRRIRIAAPVAIFALYLCWNALSVVWSYDPEASVQRVLELGQVFLLYWIVVDVARSVASIRRVALSYVCGVLGLGISAVVNIASGTTYSGYFGRFSAMGTDPNNFGVMLVSSIPLALAAAPRGWFWRCLTAGYVACAALMVLATGSRGSLVALLVVVLGYSVLQLRARRSALRNLIVVVLAVSSVLYFAPDIVPRGALDRLSTGFSEHDAGGRVAAWKLALTLGETHAVGGVGAGAFYPTSRRFLPVGMRAHNTFLEAFAEVGLPGLLLFVLLWAWHVGLVWPRPHTALQFGILLSMLAIMVGSLSLNWVVRKPVYLMWGLAVAYALSKPHRVAGKNAAPEEIPPDQEDGLRQAFS